MVSVRNWPDAAAFNVWVAALRPGLGGFSLAAVDAVFVWFMLGYGAGEADKSSLNRVTELLAVLAIPLTLGLIAYGIFQTNSAWPLVYVMTAFFGAGAGYGAATEDSGVDGRTQGEGDASDAGSESKVDGQRRTDQARD